ncbi:MAG TPA: formate dehydrogenase subunit alpha, partial [Anaerolineae bacterium]|nr:formate dehydrogenase subunit alpha [Anaerolineae bacterium]
EGTYTNTERRVQLVRPALPIRGDAKRDLDIICDLGKRLSKSNGKTFADVVHPVSDWNYVGASAVWNEIASLTPSLAGMSYPRLNPNGLQWPCPTADHPGTPILHKEKFTRGLGKFTPLVFREPAENPNDEYPFVLNTGRVLQHWHGGTMSRRSEGLDWVVPEGEIQINDEDAIKLGVENGDLIRVTSRRGTVTGKASPTSKLPRGMIFMTFHFVEVPANELTGAAVDPIAKIPEYKVSAVKVERV